MNLINDAINNHPSNKKMEEKYGHLVNLGTDGYVKVVEVVDIQDQVEVKIWWWCWKRRRK